MLFSVTEHQVAALLAAVEHTLASPQEAVLPSDGQRYSLPTARTKFGGCYRAESRPCRQRGSGFICFVLRPSIAHSSTASC